MFYFRADGNAVIGAGHLMRCLTIAEGLKELLAADEEKNEMAGKPLQEACNICFLCADEESAGLVTQKGFAARILHTDFRNMEEELPIIRMLFGGKKEVYNHVFLVDSYYVTESYLQELKSYGRVYLLDDMGKKPYPVDGVINYNAFADREYYQKLYQGRETILAIGSDFVPLRRQFLNVPYVVRKQVTDVLITTGGGAQDDIAIAVLEAIMRPECSYHVVVGQFNKSFSAWKQMERECRRIHVHYGVTDMASLMRKCDMAVTAGGTTIYELAAIGVPFLCFSCAENQEALTEYIGKEKIAGYCGAYHLDKHETLRCMSSLAKRLCEDAAGIEMRRMMNKKEKEMIDGMGAGRIAKLLLGK